jgi:hypothetical protein
MRYIFNYGYRYFNTGDTDAVYITSYVSELKAKFNLLQEQRSYLVEVKQERMAELAELAIEIRSKQFKIMYSD